MLFDPYSYDLATSAYAPRSAAAVLADNALLEVPAEARAILWQGLTEVAESAIDLWDSTLPGVRREPPPFPVQHAGKPRFDPDHLREQTLAGWHRLAGIELRLAAQALEALVLADAPRYRDDLAEQCARVGQLYSELKRRAGMSVALAILRGDVRLLRYRASPALAGLVYD